MKKQRKILRGNEVAGEILKMQAAAEKLAAQMKGYALTKSGRFDPHEFAWTQLIAAAERLADHE